MTDINDIMSENKWTQTISQKEALGLVNRVSERGETLVRYSLCPYCDDLLGTLGCHLKLVLETKSVVGAIILRTFFVKAVPYDNPTETAYIKQKRVFEQETNFFGKIVPHLIEDVDVESWAPKCYLVRDDCLVLEDLGAKGYKLRGPMFDEQTVRSAIRTIARLHASSILAEARMGKSIYDIYPDSFREMTYMGCGKTHGWCTTGIDAAVVVADSLGLDSTKIPGLYQKVLDFVKKNNNDKSSKNCVKVVSHGDLWANNLMFDDNEPANCMLVDFQFTRYVSPAQDLILLLYLCSSRDFRKRFEREMISFYHSILRETIAKNEPLVKVMSLEELMEDVEEQRLRAVVSSAIYSSSVFLSRRFAAKTIDDPTEYQKFQYYDRRDKVLEFMKADEIFKSRVEDSVKDLVEFGKKF